MLTRPVPMMVVCPVCFKQHSLSLSPGFSNQVCPKKKKPFVSLLAKTRAKNQHVMKRGSGIIEYQIRVILHDNSEQLMVFRSSAAHFELRSGDAVVVGYYKNKAKVVLNPTIHQYMRTTDKDGCFIATSAYGSYDAPQVLVFRKFRDEVLLSSGIGKSLVACYYLISPPLASFLDYVPLLKRPIRIILDLLAQHLS